ncbi:MAG: DUF2723 domain-containing protein, partial [Chloroflexi bacterium]|nr:DUF2723 domain-containing protein [Chloroflexota bacterium]
MRIRPGWLQALHRVGYPLLVCVLTLALYAHTLAPTITWRHDGYDAGDLIVGAHMLGIPHPTGYPTYMLLGKAFTYLPLGDVAYRMNLMSACCAALAIVLLYLSLGTLLQSHGDAAQSHRDAAQSHRDAAQSHGDAAQSHGDAAQSHGDATQPPSPALALRPQQKYASIASLCAAGLLASSRTYWSQALI